MLHVLDIEQCIPIAHVLWSVLGGVVGGGHTGPLDSWVESLVFIVSAFVHDLMLTSPAGPL